MSPFSSIKNLWIQIAKSNEDTSLKEVGTILRSIPMFNGFSWVNYLELAQVFHYRTYKKGAYIYFEDDPGLGLYLVQEGEVRLLTEDADKQQNVVNVLGKNELFGVVSLIGEFRRLETAQATTETKLLGLFKPDVHRLMRQYPKTGAILMDALAREIAKEMVEAHQTMIKTVGKVTALELLYGKETSEMAS